MLATAPAPSRTEALTSTGGILHVEHFDPPRPARMSLVAVHGLGLHSGLYRHVAAALNDHGVAVTLFDCRGHGRAEGPRGHVQAFSDYLADLDQVVAVARRQPDLPLSLMGHSLGGLVVLSRAFEARGTESRIVAVAPWLKLDMNNAVARPCRSKVFRRLRPDLKLENPVRTSDLSGDPEVARALESDSLIHHTLTAWGFASVLEQQDYLRSVSAPVATPTLIVLGGQDHVVSAGAAAELASRAADRVQLRSYRAMGHGLFFEPGWRTLVCDVAEWLLGDRT